MIGILSKTTNPAFNLAAEEYLLKDTIEDFFYLYVNEPSIIVGKHQNTIAEIDFNFTQKNGIPVYRRLSGGGTVFHDLGNLNFCFITNEKRGSLVDFDKHSDPIVKALENLGLTVSVGKRHDLGIAGNKITGTASHIFKTKAMHHGTLLFSSDLSILNRCLKADTQKYKGKAVKSVRSSVTNISQHLTRQMTMDEFTLHIFRFLKSYFPNCKLRQLSSERESRAINKLVREKYSTWKWNWGYSPLYKLSGSTKLNNQTVASEVTVEKGIISDVSFKNKDEETLKRLNIFATSVKGVNHNREAIISHFSKMSTISTWITKEQVIQLLF